jgi:hypothetical protein
VDFYIPPNYDLQKVKRDTFRDMGVKLKNWRHNTKVKLGIQQGDTPETVRARVGAIRLFNYHPKDLDALLNKWCDEEYQVSHELYIIILFSFINFI